MSSYYDQFRKKPKVVSLLSVLEDCKEIKFHCTPVGPFRKETLKMIDKEPEKIKIDFTHHRYAQMIRIDLGEPVKNKSNEWIIRTQFWFQDKELTDSNSLQYMGMYFTPKYSVRDLFPDNILMCTATVKNWSPCKPQPCSCYENEHWTLVEIRSPTDPTLSVSLDCSNKK